VRTEELVAISDASLAEQRRIEAADREPFDAYLERYLKLKLAEAEPAGS
jgi:hypothetical protein